MRKHIDCRQRYLGFLLIFSLIAIEWITPTDTSAQSSNLTIGNYVKVSEKRISRTVYEYSYEAAVTNIGPPVKWVSATLQSLSSCTTVVKGTLSFSNVPFMAPTKSIDSFTIRHDRLYPFKWENLSWQFTSELADNLKGTSLLIIPSMGGAISTVNAYGDVVTLEIPPNALDSPQTITLTVLDYPKVSPVTDVVFPGVSIEPHGLILKTPAKLKVILAKQLSNPQLSFLYYLRSPTVPLAIQNQVVTSNSIEGEIVHFSTYSGGSLSSITGLQQLQNVIIVDMVETNNKSNLTTLDVIAIIDNVVQLERLAKQLDILDRGDLANNCRNSAKGMLQQFVLNLLNNPPATLTPEYFYCLDFLIGLVEDYLGDKDLADRLRSLTATTLNVTPTLSYLWPGEKVQLKASMTDFYGREIPVGEVTWSSDKSSVATCSQTQGSEVEITTDDQIDCGVAYITAKDTPTGMTATAKVVVCRTQIVGYSKVQGDEPYVTRGWRITGDTDTPTVFSDIPPDDYTRWGPGWGVVYWFWQPTGINRSGIIAGNVWRYWADLYTRECLPYMAPPSLNWMLWATGNGEIDKTPWGSIDPPWFQLSTGINESNIVVGYGYAMPITLICGSQAYANDLTIDQSLWPLLTGDQRHFLHRFTYAYFHHYPHLVLDDSHSLPNPPDSWCGWAPTGINDSGKIVGWSWCAQRGYLVDASEYIAAIESNSSSLPDLTFTPLPYGVPTGINDLGDIVGYYVEPDTNYNHGFLLKAGDTFPILLPDPPGAVGWAPTGINNCGQIVGHSGYTGYLYDERGFTRLRSGIPMAITP